MRMPRRSLVWSSSAAKNGILTKMLAAVIGVIFLLLLAAAAARYSIVRPTLNRYDHIGAYVFFIVVGLPIAVVGLLLIAHYVANPTS